MSAVCSWAGIPDESSWKEPSESPFLVLLITQLCPNSCLMQILGTSLPLLFHFCLWELNAIPFVMCRSFSVAQTCPSSLHQEGMSSSGAPSVWWYQAVVFQPFHLSVTAAGVGLYHNNLRDSFSFLSYCWFQSTDLRPNGWFSEYASFP